MSNRQNPVTAYEARKARMRERLTENCCDVRHDSEAPCYFNGRGER